MKLLFLHIVKTGGTSANNAIARVCRQRKYFMHVMDGEKANDFSPAQLEQIAVAPGFDHYCHAHVGAFDQDLHALFRRNGWFTVCFIRNLGDLLCSLFCYSQKLRGGADDRTLDEYLNELLNSEPEADTHWRLPSWHSEISFVRIFSASRLRSFLRVFMNADDAKVRNMNASGSHGFGHFCATGEIKPATIAKLLAHEQSRLYAEQAARENQ